MPPSSGWRSYSVTWCPRSAAVEANCMPAMPPPTTAIRAGSAAGAGRGGPSWPARGWHRAGGGQVLLAGRGLAYQGGVGDMAAGHVHQVGDPLAHHPVHVGDVADPVR